MGIILQNNAQASVQRTGAMQSVVAAGATSVGLKSVSFANMGTKLGVVAGENLPVGASVTFDAPNGDTLAAIAYDPTKDKSNNATGTTFLITTLV